MIACTLTYLMFVRLATLPRSASQSTSSNKKPYDFYSQLIADPNPIVDQYIKRPLSNDWGSGLVPLLVASLVTQGDILELGMGFFSTALLNKVSTRFNRTVLSVDTNSQWMQKLAQFESGLHKFMHANSTAELHSFGTMDVPGVQWGLVLVDHGLANERYIDVMNFAKKAQLVLAHDAEKSSDSMYLYDRMKVRDSFKWVCKFSVFHDATRTGHTSTYVMSNYVDLGFLNEVFGKVDTDFGSVPCDFLNF
jgi:hypothetical protein